MLSSYGIGTIVVLYCIELQNLFILLPTSFSNQNFVFYCFLNFHHSHSKNLSLKEKIQNLQIILPCPHPQLNKQPAELFNLNQLH